MICNRALFVILVSVASLSVLADQTFTVVSRQSHNSQYTLDMIELALSKAGAEYQLEVDESGMSLARQIRSLREGQVDVIWAAASRQLETELLPVRVPLYKGLTGHRVFVVHEDNTDLLKDVESLDDLHAHSLGQGLGWADSQILEANGFEVREASYNRLWLMMHNQRLALFPRGIHEPWTELAEYPTLNLRVDPHVLLVYRMPFYLFVTPKRPELAEALERGLLRAVEDGSFDQLFFRNPNVQAAIRQADLAKRKVFYLDNPDLSEHTPLDDSRLWVTLDELSPESD